MSCFGFSNMWTLSKLSQSWPGIYLFTFWDPYPEGDFKGPVISTSTAAHFLVTQKWFIHTRKPGKLSGRYQKINLEQVTESQGSDNAANKREQQENAVARVRGTHFTCLGFGISSTQSARYEIPRAVDYIQSYVLKEIKEQHYPHTLGTRLQTHFPVMAGKKYKTLNWKYNAYLKSWDQWT